MELQQKLAFAKAEKYGEGFDEKKPEASIRKRDGAGCCDRCRDF